MELILIHVLPGHCHSESRRGAVVPATAFPSGRQPVAAQTAQTSLPALSLSLSLSLSSPQTKIWRAECKHDKMLGHCLHFNGR